MSYIRATVGAKQKLKFRWKTNLIKVKVRKQRKLVRFVGHISSSVNNREEM